MNIVISRMDALYKGYVLAVDSKTAVVINGNDANITSPVAVLNLDPHVVYGLSHPSVISRILDKGPQTIITSKELAHKLFEHGMKSSYETLTVGLCRFHTKIDTFYTQTLETSNADYQLKFVYDGREKTSLVLKTVRGNLVITEDQNLLSADQLGISSQEYVKYVNLMQLQDYCTISL